MSCSGPTWLSWRAPFRDRASAGSGPARPRTVSAEPGSIRDRPTVGPGPHRPAGPGCVSWRRGPTARVAGSRAFDWTREAAAAGASPRRSRVVIDDGPSRRAELVHFAFAGAGVMGRAPPARYGEPATCGGLAGLGVRRGQGARSQSREPRTVPEKLHGGLHPDGGNAGPGRAGRTPNDSAE